MSYTLFAFYRLMFVMCLFPFFYDFFVTCVVQDLMLDKVEHIHTYTYI